MPDSKYIAVYITVRGFKEAKLISEKLIKNRLAACVNILKPHTSIYEWEGKLCKESEIALIVKTKNSVFNKLIKEVKKSHSYTCPCIISFPIKSGSKDFLSWIDSSVK